MINLNPILVVDDDKHIRKLIKLYLEDSHFSVLEAEDGRQALRILEHQSIDMVIVDVMMPHINGIELIEYIRAFLDIPIIMVTAKSESHDKVRGFEAGTDDYLIKPFDPVELILRVKALLKRYNVISEQVNRLGDITISLEQLIVQQGDHIIDLKRKECLLLFELSHAPGKILTRTQLIEKVWGFDYQGDERTVDVHIKRLREKLASLPELRITTVRGLGYRLEDVT